MNEDQLLDLLEESLVNKDNTISDSFLERAITTHMSDNDVTSEDLNQAGILHEKPNHVEIELQRKANDENDVNAINQKVRIIFVIIKQIKISLDIIYRFLICLQNLDK